MTPPQADLHAAKSSLRRHIAADRDRLDPLTRERWSREACVCASQLLEETGASYILAFASFRSELDTGPLLEWAWDRKLEVYLPRVEQDRLTIHQTTGRSELEPGALRIPEPVTPSVPLDRLTGRRGVIFVPGLAFDRLGGRLGYGRGYYDRLLASWPEEPDGQARPLRAGLAYSMQLADEVPMDEHDARVDLLITEQGRIDCREGGRHEWK